MASDSNQIDFKTAVTEWLRLNEELSNIQKIVREKRKVINNLSAIITNYMKSIDKEICNVGDSDAIVLKKSKTTCALKKETVFEVLKKYLENEAVAQEVTEDIFKSRTTKEKDVLKKTNI
tara:strand:- start:1296 stop:1655 length:360 start_codon:yes stop_codon:yes gene_type:complete